jgi:histidine triad (HIT) family protein
MNCIFCQIINGQIPVDKVYEDDKILAFKDIHPVTPTHILIIPKKHFVSLNEMSGQDMMIFSDMIYKAKELAKVCGIDQSGYRLVVNTGPDAGQSVFHTHLHLLGGRKMPFHFKENPD